VTKWEAAWWFCWALKSPRSHCCCCDLQDHWREIVMEQELLSASSCRRRRPVLWRLESSSWSSLLCPQETHIVLCLRLLAASVWVSSLSFRVICYCQGLVLTVVLTVVLHLCLLSDIFCLLVNWVIWSACSDDRFVNLVVYELCKTRNCVFHHSSRFSYHCYCPYTFCCNKLYFYISVLWH